MYAPIFAVCAADPAVTALLGVSPVRIYPFGEAPQGVIKPYAVCQTVGGNPENFLAQRPDIDGYSLQIDVYGVSVTQTRDTAKAIRNAIELKANIVRWGGDSHDPATKTYRYSFDVDWLVPR